MVTSVVELLGWPSYRASVLDVDALAGQMQPLGVSVHPRSAQGSPRKGQVVFGRRDGGAGAAYGLAWDWAEIRPQVVVIGDPMVVLSNLVVLDEAGRPISREERLVLLNDLIYRTDWQREVCAHAAAALH